VILGCGIDLIEVGRIERELARRGGDSFDDLFTADEIARCRACRRPAEGYALGFAAKEAIVKALGTGLVGRMAWTDVRVGWPRTGWDGSPTVSLVGETAAVAAALGVDRVHLTAVVTLRRRSRLKPASTTDGAAHSREPASAGSMDVAGHSWEPASAGSMAGALAAAWVVLERRDPDGS
jgi:holo-[acyl-carrier protein] synthase